MLNHIPKTKKANYNTKAALQRDAERTILQQQDYKDS